MRTKCCAGVGIDPTPRYALPLPTMWRGALVKNMLTVSEALALILKEARSFGTEKIALEKSFGRVLAQDVRADRDYPPFNRSAMDGYAIVAEKLFGEKLYRVAATIFAGDNPLPPSPLPKGEGRKSVALKIMTGAAVPAPFNTVIRREDAAVDGDNVHFNIPSAAAWQNISRQGEDLKKNEALVMRGRSIDNATASLLASLGVARPQVAKLPRVAIISTGNEIIPPDKKPQPAQIRNSNVMALRAQLASWGVRDIAANHVADNRAALRRQIAARSDCDILMMTGGVSAGDTDYVPEVLTELKYRRIFHKVQIKPGKPLWFGRKGKSVVFAIPGNPFSCQVIFKVFIEPYLRTCFSMPPASALRLPLAAERRKKDQLENYFPVRIEAANGDGPSALSAIPFNGSGDVRAALFSDGIARHAADAATIAAGSVVDFFPWRAL